MSQTAWTKCVNSIVLKYDLPSSKYFIDYYYCYIGYDIDTYEYYSQVCISVCCPGYKYKLQATT